jgi:hypothetical protein
MGFLPIFLVIAALVVAVAVVCNAVLAPRVRSGQTTHGQASAASLAALLIAPAVAATLVVAVAGGPVPAPYGLSLFFYGGYAVGLVCFIVLNRRFRGLAQRS